MRTTLLLLVTIFATGCGEVSLVPDRPPTEAEDYGPDRDGWLTSQENQTEQFQIQHDDHATEVGPRDMKSAPAWMPKFRWFPNRRQWDRRQ